jgi:FkbM family methyltransferase
MSISSKFHRIIGLAAHPSNLPAELRRLAAIREAARDVREGPGTSDEAYYSQYGQDRYLDRMVFRGKRGGVFIDIGAHDGVEMSNSCLFERSRGWTGVCVEPRPATFAKLRASRSAHCANCCIGNAGGEVRFLEVEGPGEMLSGILDNMKPGHLARIDREIAEQGGSKRIIDVPVRPLADVLNDAGVTRADLLTLDIEGGELNVLRGIDFNATPIRAVCVENNEPDQYAIQNHMRAQGYEFVCLAGDEIYVNRRHP